MTSPHCTDEFEVEEEMKNPNLYVTLAASGYLWSSSVYPWQEQYPWTFNQGQ